MKIAVATAEFTKVAGHAGRVRTWLIYDVDQNGDFAAPTRLELESDKVFHHHVEGQPHPLNDITVMITLSAGDNILARMRGRGVDAVLTAETNPDQAVRSYLSQTLPPPKPRPIGGLICKAMDLFGHHHKG